MVGERRYWRGLPLPLALLLAPALSSALIVIALAALNRGMLAVNTLMIGWLLFAVPTMAACLTAGMAWHVLAMRQGWRRSFGYFFMGALMGAAIGGAVFWLLGNATASGASAWMSGAMWGGICGALTGAVFWVLRRPDRIALPAEHVAEDFT